MIALHTGPSCRSRALRVYSRLVVRPMLGFYPSRGPAAKLLDLVELGALALPRLPDMEVEHVDGGHWTAELVTARQAPPTAGAIVYFHGGAFVMCGLATHRRIAERLAEQTGMPVLSVAYRQRSEGRVDVSIRDCVEAVDWLVARGYDERQLVLAGDSAGGHLAFQVALAARDAGVGVAGVAALSPWLDFDNEARRRHPNAWRDDFIPTFRLDRMARQVTGHRRVDPTLSPVNAALEGLPPALIMCGSGEVLRHDAELMTERLEAAGVPVDLHIWEGQVHAFPVLADLLPESRAALEVIATFVVDAVAGAESSAGRLASSA